MSSTISAMEAFKSGMMAQDISLRVIGNDLANGRTTGYRAQTAEFQDVVYETLASSGAGTGNNSTAAQPIQIGLGTRFSGTSTNMTPGALQFTGNPYDMAILDGESSYFQVEKDGQVHYTRAGNFKKDANGLLVTSDGYPLQPNITIPPGARSISIGANGVVTALLPGQNDPEQLGQITLAVFTNPGGLTRVGKNLYLAGGNSGEANVVNPGENGAGSLQQSHCEGSNVNIVEKMLDMMLAQRIFESNSKGVSIGDSMMETVIQLRR